MYSANYKEFIVESEYKGDLRAPWAYENYFRNILRITNTITGKSEEFNFWGSVNRPELVSKYDLLNAFYSIVSDALIGLKSFEEFCKEYGYNPTDTDVNNLYKECQITLDKLKKVYDGDLYELEDELYAYA